MSMSRTANRKLFNWIQGGNNGGGATARRARRADTFSGTGIRCFYAAFMVYLAGQGDC